MLQSWYNRVGLTSLQANISSAVTPRLAQQTQPNVHEQPQRPANPPLSSQNNASLGVCDGFNTNNTNGMARANAVHQSFHNSIQETEGSVLHGEEPTREAAENGPSKSSDSAPPHTSSVTSMGSERYQAGNLIEIDERVYHRQLRQSLDGSQSNGKCSAIKSLTLCLQLSYE